MTAKRERATSGTCEAVTRAGKPCTNQGRFRAFLPKIGYPNVVCGRHAPATGPVIYIDMPVISKADVNEQLRHWLTPKGARLWWTRPAWQLDDQTPEDAWRIGRKQEVYGVAEGGRGMVAT